MSVVSFQMTSVLDPESVMDVLTDFGPRRPELWPTIDADHFQVHSLGDTWAEVTEGTAAAWGRARYDWDVRRRRVTITTHDSKVFGRAVAGHSNSLRRPAAPGSTSTWSAIRRESSENCSPRCCLSSPRRR